MHNTHFAVSLSCALQSRAKAKAPPRCMRKSLRVTYALPMPYRPVRRRATRAAPADIRASATIIATQVSVIGSAVFAVVARGVFADDALFAFDEDALLPEPPATLLNFSVELSNPEAPLFDSSDDVVEFSLLSEELFPPDSEEEFNSDDDVVSEEDVGSKDEVVSEEDVVGSTSFSTVMVWFLSSRLL